MLKQQRTFVVLAVIFYLLIILMGQIIGMPFGCWLLLNVFAFGAVEQLTSILALAGLGLLVKFRHQKRTLKFFLLDLACFALLALPIVGRLLAVPIDLFNYGAFIVPVSLFVIFYLISLRYSCKQYAESRAVVD